MRKFKTRATRSNEGDKYDYEEFLSPIVLERYAQYMHSCRYQEDGTLRAGDNWQKGMPLDSYMKSGWRHFMDWWLAHRLHPTQFPTDEILCALLFNVSGYLHEYLKRKENAR